VTPEPWSKLSVIPDIPGILTPVIPHVLVEGFGAAPDTTKGRRHEADAPSDAILE